MSDRNNILGDTVINFSAMAVCLAGGLATQSLLAWYLGPEGRGEYGVWLSVAMISAIVFTVGSDRAVQVQLMSRRLSVAQAVSATIAIVLVGSAFAVLFLYLASYLQWNWIERLTPSNLELALLVIPAAALTTAVQLLLAGLRHFKAAAVIGLVRTAGQLFLVALLVVCFGWGVEGALLAFVAGGLLTTVGCLLYLSRRHGKLIAVVPRDAYQRIFSYALTYIPARLGHVVNTNLVVLVLALIATRSEVGVLSLAVVLMGQFLIVSEALSQSILPRLGNEQSESIDLVTRCCRRSLMGYVFLLVVGTGVLSAAVPLLFSPQFQQVVPLLWILLPGVWLRGSARAIRSYFVAMHKPSFVSRSVAIELCVTAVTLSILYQAAGLKGAAAAASLGYVCGAITLALSFRKSTQVGFAETWLWSAMDSRCVKDRIVAMLAIPLKRRTFWDEASAARCKSGQIRRQVIVTTDAIIKKQPRESFELELRRTQDAETIARQSELFRVPKIMPIQSGSCAIHFQRIAHSKSLWSTLCEDSTSGADKLLIKAGQALAEIHDGLRYPNEDRVSLPTEWCPLAGMHDVGIHGDFTAHNILVTDPADRIVVIDWATTDLCGTQATTGPWAFDVAWFVASLLHIPPLFAPSVPHKEHRVQEFVQAYCSSTRRAANMDDLGEYLRVVADLLSRPRPQGIIIGRIMRGRRPSRSTLCAIANSLEGLSESIAA